ncbi:MAG TPA: CPBP family intramembrane glutamic endopeptidase [Chthoniobacterales bacterium]
MKDAVRLAVYFAAVIVLGALIAPILFWVAQALAQHGYLTFLAQFDFEVFFHRALLVSAIVLLWPLFRAIGVRRLSDLGLRTNKHRWRDVGGGFLAALLPLGLCGSILIVAHVYSVRPSIAWGSLGRTIGAAIVVPWVEEAFFRGLILGILLRVGRKYLAIGLTSAFYSVVHFLKAVEGTSPDVTWTSGFQSIANSFTQFSNPMLLVAGFTTLFLIGWILADARIRTASLWLPIGLHAGWILGNGVFNRIARRQMLLLPWLGKNLLVGLIPLAVVCITWVIIRYFWPTRESSV